MNYLRYHLPKKSIKSDCPWCYPRHRRTLSQYIDGRTGKPLAGDFGRCDRESNCGYHLSPYDRGSSGLSYADGVYEQWKQDNPLALRSVHRHSSLVPSYRSNTKQLHTMSRLPTSELVHIIPKQVVERTIGHYKRNQFALLLHSHFGQQQASSLLQQFQIGTSDRWPGACIFWITDEQGRTRGGQVVLFADDWHKAKYIDREGKQKPCISSVSSCLLRRCKQQYQPPPNWLVEYDKHADRWPVPFGLHQLQSAPIGQAIAIVEAPKTAIVCSAYFPQFVWLAIGSKSYLTLNNIDRLAPLRKRSIILYPDLNAYYDTLNQNGRISKGWARIADELRTQGFQVSVSSLIENHATDQQRAEGLDLADYLLQQPVVTS